MNFIGWTRDRAYETGRPPCGAHRRRSVFQVLQLEERSLLTLAPISALVNFVAGVLPSSNVRVGSVQDSDTNATQGDFSASIVWGDQTTSAGTVIASPGASGRFDVTGAHVYPNPGTYPVTVTVQDSQGQSITVKSTAVASSAQIFTFTGGLAAFPANGPNSAAGFSATNRPLFSGTAAPFSTVELFARPVKIDVNEPLGYAIASSSGQWSLATGPLADGSHTVTAVVTPPGGYPSLPQPVGNNGSVVIDTKPPRVVRVDYSGGNQVTVFFSDSISGMNLSSLSQASNYTLAGPRFAGLHPSHISVLPAGSPTNVQQVVLTLSAVRKTRSSIRALSIAGTNISNGPAGSNVGITNNAGNPLPAFSQGFASSATRPSPHREYPPIPCSRGSSIAAIRT